MKSHIFLKFLLSRQKSLPAWECGLKLFCFRRISIFPVCVTPCVGVWIEIADVSADCAETLVTPCVGVWIEIHLSVIPFMPLAVTPCVGVWIEIADVSADCAETLVTPCVGVWIEII